MPPRIDLVGVLIFLWNLLVLLKRFAWERALTCFLAMVELLCIKKGGLQARPLYRLLGRCGTICY